MRSTACEAIYVGNTNMLELRGLRDGLTGEYLSGATVTATVKDAAGANVTGESWPKALSYVDDSEGVYRVSLSHQLAVVAGAGYVAVIDVDADSGRRGRWELPLIAKVRRS